MEPIRCPNDDARLVEVERAGVLIDACPDRRGIWLDRGELDKILVKERQLAHGDDDFFSEVEGRRPERAAEAEPRHERKRRRRSLLEELLDFD